MEYGGNQIQSGETKQIFTEKIGNLIPGFFVGTAGDEYLHYKLMLMFQKEQKLKQPLRVSLVRIPPSL